MIMTILEQMHMYISAGLGVDTSLRIIEQALSKGDSNKHSRVISLIRSEVESGIALAVSLENHMSISANFINLICHGENGGRLGEAIKSVYELMEREDELKNKCLSAMYYPMIIGIIAILMLVSLMRFVIPQMIPMILSMQVQLPLLTQATLWLSGVVGDFGIYILITGILFIIIFRFVYKRCEFIRFHIQQIMLGLPILGQSLKHFHFSMMMRSIGMMVNSGMPVTSAYKDVVKGMSMLPLKRKFIEGHSKLDDGIPLSKVIAHQDLPEYICAMVTAGESTGSLGDTLLRSANVMDAELTKKLKSLTALIEPLMMVGMGGMVGAISLSIMMPIYDMSKILEHTH